MDKIHQIIPVNVLQNFCIKWKIKTFYIFGSILRDDFKNNSDIDVMVEFSSDAEWTLLDHVDMRDELISLSGRSIDLLTKKSIERSQNQTRKEEILRTAKAIYDSAA
ncbi:MAG: nucleotidyltransferase domain-containing protein [Bacteriovoracaceae bacterium]|jgi:predicted nucleotidyltransferase|nr:nucleotidyltransferase domain-containing protein [Bacteriovoracaceae bacterium]